ncbi:MAG: sulfite exporter TauE/SafE family protein [Burkholderiales bacterium]
MSVEVLMLIAAAFFVVAVLYTTVGHAGASGYLAVMAIAGLAPEVMRPTALALNIVVASITVYRFRRARFVSWPALWPFLLGSVPLAAIGGALRLPPGLYYKLVGVVLLLSAVLLVWRVYYRGFRSDEQPIRIRKALATPIGAGVGLLSGITGTGGGIFLSPILLLSGWAGPKGTAGISAPFILINSITALVAGSLTTRTFPPELPWLAAAAVGGALLGTWLGLSRLSQRGLVITLAVVMLVAAGKLFGIS